MSDADRIDVEAYTPEFAMFRPQLFPIGGHCKDFQELSTSASVYCTSEYKSARGRVCAGPG